MTERGGRGEAEKSPRATRTAAINQRTNVDSRDKLRHTCRMQGLDMLYRHGAGLHSRKSITKPSCAPPRRLGTLGSISKKPWTTCSLCWSTDEPKKTCRSDSHQNVYIWDMELARRSAFSSRVSVSSQPKPHACRDSIRSSQHVRAALPLQRVVILGNDCHSSFLVLLQHRVHG